MDHKCKKMIFNDLYLQITFEGDCSLYLWKENLTYIRDSKELTVEYTKVKIVMADNIELWVYRTII